MPRLKRPVAILLDNVSATGASRAVNVEGYTHVSIALVTSNSANLQIQPLVGMKTADPSSSTDFTSAKSVGNLWSTVSFTDVNEQSAIDGSTGLVVNTDTVKIIELNVNGKDFVGLNVSAYTAGNLTAFITAYTNE